MKYPALLFAVVLFCGCASSNNAKHCDIDAAGREQAMANIALALRENPEIRAEQYIREPFEPQTVYNGKDHCTFIIRPWQPIQSELIWDGALGFRVNKASYAVEDVIRIDE